MSGAQKRSAAPLHTECGMIQRYCTRYWVRTRYGRRDTSDFFHADIAVDCMISFFLFLFFILRRMGKNKAHRSMISSWNTALWHVLRVYTYQVAYHVASWVVTRIIPTREEYVVLLTHTYV